MKIFSNKRLVHLILLFPIVLLASFFRFYGLNWDQNQHLHPDERFLTMVATAIKIPSTVSEYLTPQISSMSPYNTGYNFFVYGTFPLYLTKIVGIITNNDSYGNIHFVGRILSAFFDIGTVLLIYQIAKKINSKNILNTKYLILNTPLLAAFLYSIMVLPIQLSHFFAVDTFLNFFIILSFFFLVRILDTKYLILNTLFLGISFGLALACKITAVLFLPIIGLGYLFLLLKNLKNYKYFKILISGIIFCIVSIFVFRLSQPIAFKTGNFFDWNPNPKFLSNLKELQSLNDPNASFPPAVQWQSAKPLIFPFKNLVLWGMGLPLGIISVISLGYTIAILLSCYLDKKKKLNTLITNHQLQITSLIVLWILGLFMYQGLQFSKTMRYFLPIYPFLALLSANFLSKLNIKFIIFIIVIIFIYPLSFLSIYSRPITRVTASEWIYKNIPAGSIVVNEEWDDPIPLILPDYPYNIYQGTQVLMYDPDTQSKWLRISPVFKRADYLFLTSNRAYGSTMKLPEKYPLTTKFYQSLFEGTGEFKKAAEFTSYPCFPPFGEKHLFCFNDDGSEEAFTVYDHPKVLIFKKK